MSSAQFYAIIQHTQNYACPGTWSQTTCINRMVNILNGDGTCGSDDKFLASAELSAAWNGKTAAAAGPGDVLGALAYNNPAGSSLNGLTVNTINGLIYGHLYPSGVGCGTLTQDEENYLLYTGSGAGEFDGPGVCEISGAVPLGSLAQSALFEVVSPRGATPTPAWTPTPTPAKMSRRARIEGVFFSTPTATPTPTQTHKLSAANHIDSVRRQFCTLSQAAWGSGVANGPTGFITRDPAILPVTIGGVGRSTTVGTVAALSAYLPTNGPPQALLAGDHAFAAARDITNDGGGSLSGETAALTLAVYLSDSGGAFDGLSAFVLPAREFCTQALTAGPDGIIGTADDDIDSSSAITGPWMLPAAVAANSTTVEAVVNLANESLQGIATGVSPSHVNAGVAAINQAFDNCRRIVACQ